MYKLKLFAKKPVPVPFTFALGASAGAGLMWMLLLLTVTVTNVVAAVIPAPPVGATSSLAVVPERISVPAIALDAAFTDPLGLNDNGTIMVPSVFDKAGWYKYSPLPGERGPAVVLGHINSKSGQAVFYDLRALQPGDIIDISLSNGSTTSFVVERATYFAQDTFPAAEVYGDIDHAGLRLISCSGSFNPLTKKYSHNLVVFARAR